MATSAPEAVLPASGDLTLHAPAMASTVAAEQIGEKATAPSEPAAPLPPLDPSLLPPLEPCAEQRTRRLVLAAFLVLYLGCLPLWYATSRVQRVAIDTLTPEDHTQASPYLLPLELHVLHSTASLDGWARTALAYVQAQLTSGEDQPDAHLRWQTPTWDERAMHTQDARDIIADRSQQGDVRVLGAALDRYVANRPTSTPSPNSFVLPSWHLAILFVEGDVLPAAGVWTMSTQRCAFTVMRSGASATERQAHLEQGVAMLQSMVNEQVCSKASSASQIVCSGSRALSQRLSFILLNDEGDESLADAQEWTWNFPQIKQAFLSGFLRSVAPFVTFTVDSSVSHYGRLTEVDSLAVQVDAATHAEISGLPQPIRALVQNRAADAAAPSTTLSAYQLSLHSLKTLIGVVGSWNTPSPLVQTSFELIAYVPPQAQRPLFFNFAHDGMAVDPTVSLFVPRYGGVAIVNSPGNCSTSGPCALPLDGAAKDLMQVFVQQIRHTLALPKQSAQCSSCVYLASLSTGVSSWELDLLASRLTHLNLVESARVLTALNDLLESVPHMPVSLEIQQLVSESLRQRRFCLGHLAAQRWSEAGFASQAAERASHEAFFHPAMLPALYFPDEHLYAVYLPLFLPTCVPLLLALAALITRRAEKKKLRERQRAQAIVGQAAQVAM